MLGKLRDLSRWPWSASTLLVSRRRHRASSAGSPTTLLAWLGLGHELAWLVQAARPSCSAWPRPHCCSSRCSGCSRSPRTPHRSLWQGALLGAVGFEVLKQLSRLLLAATKGQPAFQAFGIALILLVWINYFSRVVLYAAAWAHTSRAARAQRYLEPADPIQGPQSPPLSGRAARAGGGAVPTRVVAFRRGCGDRAGTGGAAAPYEQGGTMTLDRKHGWLLVGDRRMERLHLDHVRQEPLRRLPGGGGPRHGYWVAHTILIVVGLVTAVLLLGVARRVLRRP